MTMTVNFLLQATRVLEFGNYDETELVMITNFMVGIDEEVLSEYKCTCTILSYENDLELYIEILNALIDVFEEREEYETCEKLKLKKEESIKINNLNTI
jgi:hypothetical protein